MDTKFYAQQFARWHSIWERKAAPILYRALVKTVNPVIASLDPDALIKKPWIDAYKEVYKLIGKEAASREYRQLRRDNPTKEDLDIVSFYNAQWQLTMERYGSDIAFDFADDLNDTTIAEIRRVLAYSFSNNYTNRQIADALRGYLLDDGKVRALRIARTEATTAASIGKNEGAKTYFKEIGETEGFKMWISRADTAVRHSHVEANETAVPFEEDFKIGFGQGLYPGDPKLKAEDRVNCRCTFVSLSKNGYNRRLRMGTVKPNK